MKRIVIIIAAIVAGYALGRACTHRRHLEKMPEGFYLKFNGDPHNVFRFMRREDVSVYRVTSKATAPRGQPLRRQ